jgi:hypothetical protein
MQIKLKLIVFAPVIFLYSAHNKFVSEKIEKEKVKMGRNQLPKANLRGAVPKGEITGGKKTNARQMAQTDSENSADASQRAKVSSQGK